MTIFSVFASPSLHWDFQMVFYCSYTYAVLTKRNTPSSAYGSSLNCLARSSAITWRSYLHEVCMHSFHAASM